MTARAGAAPPSPIAVRRPGKRSTGRDRRGQAAVELALVLPLLAVLLLAVIQVALIVRDQVLVVHAAREGAREGAVDGSPGAPRRAVLERSGLDPGRTEVAVTGGGGPGQRLEVRVRYRSATDAPLVGTLFPDVDLAAKAAIRDES